MCRFVLYRGADITISSLVTTPSNSLIHQSFDNQEREEPLNGDGFGIAWYAPEVSAEPALFRAISPAWNNQNLRHLARVTHSRTILAHVRAATPGLPVHQLNCHPFSWGPFAFMHNGHLGGFRDIKRRLLERLSDEAFGLITGSTDSEHLFALFVDRYRELGPSGQTLLSAAPEETVQMMPPDRAPILEVAARGDAKRMARALIAAIADVEELRRSAGVAQESQINAAVSDGTAAVATRFTSDGRKPPNSLWVQVGQRWVCEGRDCRMLDPELGRGAVIISSERLDDDPGWDRVPANQMAVVGEGLTVGLLPMEV